MKHTVRIWCGTCGKRAKLSWGETYTMSRSAHRAAVAAGHGERNPDGSVRLGPEVFNYAPDAALWRWTCSGCGSDWQVPLNQLEERSAAGPIALGIDLG